MCTGLVFPAWQARAIRELLALGGVEPALLIVDDRASANRPVATSVVERLRRGDAVWAAFSRYVARRSKATEPVDLSEVLAATPVLRCRVRRQGRFSEIFEPEDVEEIRKHELDFIIRFAFGVIRGDILRAARLGVWSFHHDDEERYRGGPPCFWEIYSSDPVTGSMLQRLTDRLDGGVVLHKGYFATIRHSYVRSRDSAYFGSADWPARVCKDIQNGAATYLEAAPSSSTANVYRNPRARQMVVFAAKLSWNLVAAQIRGGLLSDQWNVGIIDSPIHTLLEPDALSEVRWLPDNPKTRYIADPFAAQLDGHLEILVEDFDYRTNRGVISAIRAASNGSFHSPQPVMDLGIHASYPYLISHGGEWYCVPEIAESHAISLFKARKFPEDWEKVATLVKDFDALDPTVFRHGDFWWLLCTDRKRGPNTKLWGWYAQDLLGPWTAHGANPLKTDVRSSRPAGTPFVHDGILYRPAQDDSRTYGGAVTVNRVLALSPTEFREEIVKTLEPQRQGPYGDGLHTITAAGDVTILDGKRRVFVWSGFNREVRARAQKFVRIGGYVPSAGGSS
jgi:hypothetical protein